MAAERSYAEKTGADCTSTLRSTVDTFENRLARKLKEQENKHAQSLLQKEARHGHMLKSLGTIRKALLETSKMKLGDRFGFRLEVGDANGWPKLTLHLCDGGLKGKTALSLTVSAHDRRDLGTIEIKLNASEVLGALHLSDPDEIPRIPLALKKSMRIFLDSVASFVLNAPPIDEAEQALSNLEEEPVDTVSARLKGENLFVDDEYGNDNVLSPLINVEPIKSF